MSDDVRSIKLLKFLLSERGVILLRRKIIHQVTQIVIDSSYLFYFHLLTMTIIGTIYQLFFVPRLFFNGMNVASIQAGLNQIIILIFLQIAIFEMSREQQLEEKLRKSQSLTEENIYQDFKNYAAEVSDELDVLIYMEENKIGINLSQYWICRLKIHQRRCQMKEIARLLKKIKTDRLCQDTTTIEHFEKMFIKDMETIINSRFRGKRRVDEFQKRLQINTQIHPEKRMIGNIQVYVDPYCRSNYNLQDYAKYIEQQMQDYCTIERQSYNRTQKIKPPSFIAKKEMHLMELTQQVFAKTHRLSNRDRQSQGPSRHSNSINMFKNYDNEEYNTPKNNQSYKNDTQRRTSTMKEKRKKDSSRDSVQILKSLHKQKRLSATPNSPKFKGLSLQQQQSIKSLKYSSQQKGQICRSTVNLNEDFIGYSFGKECRKQFNSQRKYKTVNQKYEAINKINDNAFIFNSFSQQNSDFENQQIIKQADFQLGLIIGESQRQAYEQAESKTFSSEIGSNQENIGYIDINKSNKAKERKPFQIIQDSEIQNNKYNLQDLMNLVDQKNPQQQFGEVESDMYSSNYKKRKSNLRQSIFRSQNNKRLSDISEQQSYYSETKHLKSH